MPAPPPPDFRYVGLSPASPPEGVALAAIAGSGVLALAAASQASPRALLVSLALGGVATALARRGARAFRRFGDPAPMAIVPWGVIIRPDADDERVLRWPGVKRITVEHRHTRDVAGAAATVESYVTVETSRERLAGRAAGHVSLERLIAFLDAYREECARPVAVDLEGHAAADGEGDGIVRELLDNVRAFLVSATGRDTLALERMSYRDETSMAASRDAVDVLRRVLRAAHPHADPRPFAALLAGELGAASLVPDLVRLVTSVHPLVAACAKSAALRLGADAGNVGGLSEVAPFLSEEDLGALSAWVSTKP